MGVGGYVGVGAERGTWCAIEVATAALTNSYCALGDQVTFGPLKTDRPGIS